MTIEDPAPQDVVRLQPTATGVQGEASLLLEPGTRADAQHHTIDAALSSPLSDAAAELGLTLVARPSAYAFAQPGKDEAGRCRFVVRGRIEGDFLVPALHDPEMREEIAIRLDRAKRKRRS
jgi:hypothetical protein